MDSIFMYDSVSGRAAPDTRHSPGKKAKKTGDRRRTPADSESLRTADFFLLEGGRGGAYRRILPSHGGEKVAPRAKPFRPANRTAAGTQTDARAPFVADEKPRSSGFGLLPKLVAGAAAIPAGAMGRIGRLAGEARVKLPALRWAANTKLLLVAGTAILVVAFTAAALALSVPRFPLPEGGLVRNIPSVQSDLLDFLTPELSSQVTETSLPPLPLSLATDSYTVAKGDTLGSIAAQNHVDIDTIVSMNNITSAKGLGIGQVLKIPNMKGIVHVVAKGESLGVIAKANKVTVTAIADANNLGSGIIIPGQAIFIPGARLTAAALRQVFGDMVIWPVKGIISSWFGYRPDPFTGVRSFHGGLDLAVPQGTPVKAAMDGRIADVGYNQMFGNYVIINHDKGLQTLYGHLSRQEVHVGQAIAQGQILGLSGNTGYSTAPHLHFGVYRGGVSVNPLKYLPGSHP